MSALANASAADRPLRGQVAVVTGGGTGIGRAGAIALAQAGAKVAVVSREQRHVAEAVEEIRSQYQGDAIGVTADVTRGDEVRRAAAVVQARLGPVDILVNNAGTAQAVGPLWQVDADLWWRDVEVSLRGTLLWCHAVLPSMVARRRGRIINVASAAAFMTLPMASSYACAKAGVVRLTDALAASVAQYGIAVFAISPGPTKTAMTTYLLESPEGRKWMPELHRIPPSEWTQPRDVGDFMVALARGDVDVLSGRFLHVKQNLTELVRRSGHINAHDLLSMRLRE